LVRSQYTKMGESSSKEGYEGWVREVRNMRGTEGRRLGAGGRVGYDGSLNCTNREKRLRRRDLRKMCRMEWPMSVYGDAG